MRSILFRSEPEGEDPLIGELWEQGTVGIAEESGGLRAYFEESVDWAGIIASHASAILEFRTEKERDWELLSRENWDPLFAGKRFFIVPPWLDTPTPSGRIRLVSDSVNAFGTGRHESTQLVLEAMEVFLGTRESCVRAGQRVLDVGCGSGILSRAAVLLGAERVFACDIDWAAVSEARGKHQIDTFMGSVQAVRTASVDLVLANISAAALDALASDLERICRPGGGLLLAGFLSENPPKQFQPRRILELEGWACWVCDRVS